MKPGDLFQLRKLVQPFSLTYPGERLEGNAEPIGSVGMVLDGPKSYAELVEEHTAFRYANLLDDERKRNRDSTNGRDVAYLVLLNGRQGVILVPHWHDAIIKK